MTTETRTAAQTSDHGRELERAVGDALVRVVGHMAGYGALLACIWYERRTPKHATT